MSVSPGCREFVRDLFSGIDGLTIRAMFGGAGLYSHGTMFALVDDDTIYIKAHGPLADALEAEGSQAFVYAAKGKPVRMSYWQIPDSALDEPERAVQWARRSIEAARAGA